MPYRNWRRTTFLGLPGRLFRHIPYLVAGIYAAVSAAWIVFSDRLLTLATTSHEQYEAIQTVKGVLFILLSALLILLMLRWAWRSILTAYQALLESEHRTRLTLAAAGGGIWEVDVRDDLSSTALISPEFTAKLGFPADQPLTVAELRARQHPDDAERIERAFADTIQSGGARSFDLTYRMLGFDGRYRWVHSRGNLINSGASPKIVAVSLDVTDRMEARERVEELLRFDGSTGLPKAEKFAQEVDDEIASVPPGRVMAVMKLRLLDLATLLGESESPDNAAIIRLIGDRLHEIAADGLMAARDGTASFALATRPQANSAAAARTLETAFRRLAEPYFMDGRDVRARFAAGAALFPQDGGGAQALLRNARYALDAHPEPAEINWFTETLDTEFTRRNKRLRDLANAVANDEIVCHFQPLVDLRTGLVCGMEALARWQHPAEGLIQPVEFIGLAEEFGYIREIGEQVLGSACREAASWPAVAGRAPFVSVNVAAAQLDSPSFPSLVARILAETGLDPRRLELEITESALPGDPEAAADRLGTLRQLGVRIAMDDFGTGYSSLSVLGKLPFDRIKIDRSFVAEYGRSHDGTTIADMIMELGRHLGLEITAEGIETEEQALLLRSRQVDLGQGYLFSRPVPAHEVAALLSRRFELRPAPGRRAASGGAPSVSS